MPKLRINPWSSSFKSLDLGLPRHSKGLFHFTLYVAVTRLQPPSPALDGTLGPTEPSLPITGQARKHFLEGGVRLPGQGMCLCFAEEDGKRERSYGSFSSVTSVKSSKGEWELLPEPKAANWMLLPGLGNNKSLFVASGVVRHSVSNSAVQTPLLPLRPQLLLVHGSAGLEMGRSEKLAVFMPRPSRIE